MIIVLIVLAGAVYVLFAGLPWKDSSKGSSKGVAETDGGAQDNTDKADAAGSPAGHNDEEDIVPWNPVGVSSLFFYDIARVDRYESFAARMPELPYENVVWMVDADLDIPPYSDTKEVPDPMELTLLVNKHFFLPDGFAPADLVTINNTMLRKETADAMQEMIDAAAGEGHNLWVQSGYRSYEIQVNLYNQYSERDGPDAADTYSARPGYSEHQTGLTADLNTITDAFGETPEGRWVTENCWQYGFIVRYTKENTDITLYRPEPWHVRYIGKEAAANMHDVGFLSYEEYWVKFVKYAPPSAG